MIDSFTKLLINRKRWFRDLTEWEGRYLSNYDRAIFTTFSVRIIAQYWDFMLDLPRNFESS